MSDAAYDDGGGYEPGFEEMTQAEANEPDGGDGGEDGEPQERPQRAPLSPEEAQKRYHNAKGALAKERSLRRDLEQRLSALEATKADSEPDPLAAIAASMRDDDFDPLGDLDAVKRLAKAMVDQQERERKQNATQTAEQRRAQALQSQVAEHEAEFRADNPDYDDAFKHLLASRTEELAETGLQGAELNSAMRNELVETVNRALSAGRDPAATIYALAKKRGFGVDSATKRLQTIQSGQLAGRSLSEAGGRNGDRGGITAQAVIKAKGPAKLAAFAKFRAQALAEERRG